MYTKREAKKLLRQVRAILYGSTYGDVEGDQVEVNFYELEKLEQKLLKIIDGGK